MRFWGIEAEREHEKSRELQRKAVAEEVIGGQPYENVQPWVQGFGVWGKKTTHVQKFYPGYVLFGDKSWRLNGRKSSRQQRDQTTAVVHTLQNAASSQFMFKLS